MQKPKRAIVIHSPHSGRAAQLSQALNYLQQVGVVVAQVLPISDLDGLPPQGAVWQQSGIDIAIAAGGDGLVGGTITHIAESGLPLGIMPLGTANDIARALLIPQLLLQAAEVIAWGKEQEVDIGVAHPAEQAPHVASKGKKDPVHTHVPLTKHGFFAHALTIGLNVQFARVATNVATRQRYGFLTYTFAALEVLKRHEALDVSLHLEELVLPSPGISQSGQGIAMPASTEEPTTLPCHALEVAVINAPIFAGQWQFSIPGASLKDRLLDVVVIEDIDLEHLSIRLAQLFNSGGQQPSIPQVRQENHFSHPRHHPGELTGIPGIHHLQARGVVVTTNADPQDATLDGEVRGQTPIYAHVADERLKVLVPR